MALEDELLGSGACLQSMDLVARGRIPSAEKDPRIGRKALHAYRSLQEELEREEAAGSMTHPHRGVDPPSPGGRHPQPGLHRRVERPGPPVRLEALLVRQGAVEAPRGRCDAPGRGMTASLTGDEDLRRCTSAVLRRGWYGRASVAHPYRARQRAEPCQRASCSPAPASLPSPRVGVRLIAGDPSGHCSKGES
jgi:hypothetical protein